jgi:hypothetical protein
MRTTADYGEKPAAAASRKVDEVEQDGRGGPDGF